MKSSFFPLETLEDGRNRKEEIALRQGKIERITRLKTLLEQEAKKKAEQIRREQEEKRQQAIAEGRSPRGRKPKPPSEVPEPKAQRNFTDPDSRIMLDGATKSYLYAYNAQVAADPKFQVIVAEELTNQASDNPHLPGTVTQVTPFIPPDRLKRDTLTKPASSRKSVIEPVIGQIKVSLNFRQFSFRGMEKVKAEWRLTCACHNLMKLFRHLWEPGCLQF